MIGKIRTIVTVGPASRSTDILKKLKANDVDSFRLNLSHMNKDSLIRFEEELSSLGIVPSLDTQGPQLRISSLSGKTLHLNGSDRIILTAEGRDIEDQTLNARQPIIEINHPEALSQLHEGDYLRLDFDGVICKVVKGTEDDYTIELEVVSGGTVNQNRAIDLVSKQIKLNPFTPLDKFAVEKSRSWKTNELFISFCSGAEAIDCARNINPELRIISKIESIQGLYNLDEILTHTDAILIDRGDLSREIGISRVPRVVKSIINKAHSYQRPVYVATNILDSMMTASLPSRSEISDIYTLLELGVSGIVLAAECAIGAHPVESVQLVNYLKDLHKLEKDGFLSVSDIDRSLKDKLSEPLRTWI